MRALIRVLATGFCLFITNVAFGIELGDRVCDVQGRTGEVVSITNHEANDGKTIAVKGRNNTLLFYNEGDLLVINVAYWDTQLGDTVFTPRGECGVVQRITSKGQVFISYSDKPGMGKGPWMGLGITRGKIGTVSVGDTVFTLNGERCVVRALYPSGKAAVSCSLRRDEVTILPVFSLRHRREAIAAQNQAPFRNVAQEIPSAPPLSDLSSDMRQLEAVDLVVPSAPSSQSEVEQKSEVQVTSGDPSEENSESCKICYEGSANVVLIPCGHLVLCEKCAQLITICPMCRKVPKLKLKTYKS